MKLTLEVIEAVASNFLEKYELRYGNEVYYTDFPTLTIIFEGPNNWTIGLNIDIENIETVEELIEAIEHEYLREVEYASVDEYFNDMYDCVSRRFAPREFLGMIEEDMEHFQSVANKIKGLEESVVTGDLSTIIYNLEQMDFAPEEILMRLEDCFRGYTFKLAKAISEKGDIDFIRIFRKY